MASVYSESAAREIRGFAGPNESSVSAASWPAISAGAVVAVSATVMLVALGSGIGLASVSPWSNSGASATTFTVMTAIWLIIVQWVASALGGYITGRLRTKWAGTHTHEVFFRDTAHGFVTWAVATLIGALLFAFAAAGIAGKGIQAASITPGAATDVVSSTPLGDAVAPYDVDRLIRSGSPDVDTSNSDRYTEITRILAQGLTAGGVSSEDRVYLTNLVAARAGITQQDAQRRVDDIIAQSKAVEVKAREALDTARKAAAETSIFMALSMLVGAFVACAAAALGGKLRDQHP